MYKYIWLWVLVFALHSHTVLVLAQNTTNTNTKPDSNSIDIPTAVVKRSFLKERSSLQLSAMAGYVLPSAGTNTYISIGAFQPVGINLQFNLAQKYGLGVELSHNYLQQKRNRAVYYYDGSVAASNQSRTLAFQPLMVYGMRYLNPVEKQLRPYVLAGLGAMRINYINYWGIFEDPKKRIKPAITAGMGFKLSVDENQYWVLEGKVKYTYAPFKYDFITAVNYIGIDLLLGIRWWPSEPE
jgi:opacity protein-like surface antigen